MVVGREIEDLKLRLQTMIFKSEVIHDSSKRDKKERTCAISAGASS